MPWGKSVSVPQPDLNFHSKSAQWKSYSSAKERVAALQIPEDKLKSLTTADLLTVCLDFPYAMDMLAYDYPEVGFNAVCKEFNGCRELLTRKDLTDALLKKCEAIPAGIASVLNKDEVTQGDYSFKCYILFYMMGIDKGTSSLDAEKSAKFAASIREAATKMKAYPDIFGISYRTGVKKSGISLLSNPAYNDATRTIPNGYSVYIKELVSGELSSSEKKSYKNWAINVHKAEFIEDATYTYNCHLHGHPTVIWTMPHLPPPYIIMDMWQQQRQKTYMPIQDLKPPMIGRIQTISNHLIILISYIVNPLIKGRD